MVKFTLHDIFGYLFPGFVTLAAIAIWIWPYCLPQTMQALLDYRDLVWPLLLIALIAAYILGTLVTSIAGKILFFGPMQEVLPESIKKRLRSEVTSILGKGWEEQVDRWEPRRELYLNPLLRIATNLMLGTEFKNIEDDEQRMHLLDRTCDEYVLQFEKGGHYLPNRDLFLYRIDYYRGSAIAFLLLCLSSGASLVWKYGGHLPNLPWGLCLAISMLLAAIIGLIFFNYWRKTHLKQNSHPNSKGERRNTIILNIILIIYVLLSIYHLWNQVGLDCGSARSPWTPEPALTAHLLTALISLLAAWAFTERLKRFWRLRQYYIAVNFLILRHLDAPEYPPEKPNLCHKE